MAARELLGAAVKVLGFSVNSITDAVTQNFDFGTPNDLDLRALAYVDGDRLLVVFSANTDGVASKVTFGVLDAPDAAGSIGATATALTDENADFPAAQSVAGDNTAVIGVRVQPSRPWLRVTVTSDNAADTVVCTATVLAIPSGL